MRTRVKICGLKRTEDVTYANALLPDYIGFVFALRKRLVTDEQARRMRSLLDRRIQAVGVFINEPINHVLFLLKEGIIDLVQLHGEEDEGYIATLKKHTDKPVIQAVQLSAAKEEAEQLTVRVQEAFETSADYLLFDSGCGSGRPFDWSLLEQIKRAQASRKKPFFIAGGLTPENVSEAIAGFHPFAVDISSGVETDGVKDFDKMKKLLQAVTEW